MIDKLKEMFPNAVLSDTQIMRDPKQITSLEELVVGGVFQQCSVSPDGSVTKDAVLIKIAKHIGNDQFLTEMLTWNNESKCTAFINTFCYGITPIQGMYDSSRFLVPFYVPKPS